MQNRLITRIAARPMRQTLRTVALATLGASALPIAGAGAAPPGHFKIVVHIANHAPIVNRRWPIELTISHGGKKLNGSIRYQFLFAGVVVRTQPQHGAFRFKHGVFQDDLIFPGQSVGQPLTLRFVVTTRYGTEHADWKLETRK